jgi:hypothetical protein
MKRLVPGLLMMFETSMNFREPYTMNTTDISIRLAKITMSDISPSRLLAMAGGSTARFRYNVAGELSSQ